MPSITVDRDRCKGCELCTHYCPMGILGMSKEINLKGYFFSTVVDPGRCIGCTICALTCPDLAITVHGTAVCYRLFEYIPEVAGTPSSASR